MKAPFIVLPGRDVAIRKGLPVTGYPDRETSFDRWRWYPNTRGIPNSTLDISQPDDANNFLDAQRDITEMQRLRVKYMGK
jgi:hypothetical protein